MPKTETSATASNPAHSPGKRVGGAVYLHRDALDHASVDTRRATHRAAKRANLESTAFNVVKLEGDPPRRVSLLAYEDFERSPFPVLLDSWTVDVDTGRTTHRSYRAAANPPILHRKELLLAPDDPRRPKFAALTDALEARGLFRDTRNIGFRRAWEKRLAAAGIEIRDHAVVETAGNVAGETADAAPAVARHRTAMSRQGLSTPMQALARHGFLEGVDSVFDYGCGRGDDLAVLAAAGIPASGWDPYYAPDAPREAADVVNLGYVLNVIETPAERTAALEAAFALAHRLLCVAVMIVGKADVSGLTPHGDGFLTARGTFQKYFTQEEARELIETTLGAEAIPVAPGVFFVFRDKLAEQRFLEGRARRRRDISHLLAIAPPAPATPPAHDQAILAEHREVIDGLWRRALELGRLPYSDELDPALSTAIGQAAGSIRKAAQLAQLVHDPATLPRAREARVSDLQVYFALNLFNRRRRYGELPAGLQRDVKAFFGAYAQAEAAGRQLLFSVNDPETILAACRQAEEAGHGHLFEGHSLQFHAALIERLPPVLRIYVGCAEKLYGAIDEETADLVKIHIASGKLTLLRYDDFFGKPLPRLIERVKINMRERDVDFFDHADDKAAPRLTMKSRYMAPDQAGYQAQRCFDAQLSALELFNLEGYGPTASELARGLTRAGYRVAGFELVRRT